MQRLTIVAWSFDISATPKELFIPELLVSSPDMSVPMKKTKSWGILVVTTVLRSTPFPRETLSSET